MKPFAAAGLVLAGAALGALGLEAAHRSTAPDADDVKAPPAAASAAAASEAPEAGGGLKLGADEQKESGIRLAPLGTGAQPGGETGYARAMDLSPLAAIAAEESAAAAALAASSRELARLQALNQADAGAALKDVEAARAQTVADRARLTLACQRVGLEFGPGLARIGCGAVPGLARDAAAGRLAVMRVDFPGSAPQAGTSVTVDLAPGGASLRLIGPAMAGDSALQSAGALALLRGPQAARVGVGRVLSAHRATGPVSSGVLVPREAIVRTEGGLFVWRAKGDEQFERVPLEGAVVAPQGWLVPPGKLNAGDRVVVSGAGTLLGLEHAAPAAEED